MFYIKSLQRFISIAAVIVLVWTGIVPACGRITAVNAEPINNKVVLEQKVTSPNNEGVTEQFPLSNHSNNLVEEIFDINKTNVEPQSTSLNVNDRDKKEQQLNKEFTEVTDKNNVVVQEPFKPSNDWYEIDKHLAQAVRNAYNSTEDYALAELDNWQEDLLKKVDDKFLNWYFSYSNQKLMEFGIPFAWAGFKLDSALKVLRKEDEKTLNAGEIIKKRMIEDFNSKFQELVLNEDSEKHFKQIVRKIGSSYASGLGVQFLRIKSYYKVSDPDWEQHLNAIANNIYDTGNQKSSLDIDSFNSQLLTRVFNLTTTAISLKLAANFAAKAGSKIAAKAGASVMVKAGAQLIDPILIVGFLAWDVWDYNHMVADSKPQLRQNIADYLNEVKYSLLSAPDNSIMAAVKDVESGYLYSIESQPI